MGRQHRNRFHNAFGRYRPVVELAVLAAIFLGCRLIWVWAQSRVEELTPPQRSSPVTYDLYMEAFVREARRGAMLYETHCSKCHGQDGHGDGEEAANLPSAPRPFAYGRWTRSSAPGNIARLIRDGIPGTPMAGTGDALSSAELAGLAKHVLLLARRPVPAKVKPRDEFESALQASGFHAIEMPPLELRLTSTTGETATLAEFRDRVVMLHFWGTSYRDSLSEIPQLLEGVSESDFVILSVCADVVDLSEVERAGRPQSGERMLWIDDSRSTEDRFDTSLLPCYALFDTTGRPTAFHPGALETSKEALNELVRVLKSRGER